MIFLVLISGVLGFVIDYLGLISGGLISNITGLFQNIGLGALAIIFNSLMGLVVVMLFPVHWVIMYRDAIVLIGVLAPWIVTCVITSALFAHSPRGGLHTSLAIAIGWMILFIVGYFVLTSVIGRYLPGGADLIDVVATAFTDLPFVLAVILAGLEGGGVGGVFGAFIGSLKYKPEGIKASSKPKKVKNVKAKKSKKDKGEKEVKPASPGYTPEPKSSSDAFCTNCGAKFVGMDAFCTNCGAKR